MSNAISSSLSWIITVSAICGSSRASFIRYERDMRYKDGHRCDIDCITSRHSI